MTTTFGQNVKLLFSIEGRDKNKFRKENKSSEWWHTHICSKTFKIILTPTGLCYIELTVRIGLELNAIDGIVVLEVSWLGEINIGLGP